MTARAGLRLTPAIVIAPCELALSFVRASGPGGQNVNKVASKAIVRFNVRDSRSLPPALRARAVARLASRLTAAGEIIVTSGIHREQTRNREAALARLRAVLVNAIRAPRARKPSRPPVAANERRLARKRRQGERKRERRLSDD